LRGAGAAKPRGRLNAGPLRGAGAAKPRGRLNAGPSGPALEFASALGRPHVGDGELAGVEIHGEREDVAEVLASRVGAPDRALGLRRGECLTGPRHALVALLGELIDDVLEQMLQDRLVVEVVLTTTGRRSHRAG